MFSLIYSIILDTQSGVIQRTRRRGVYARDKLFFLPPLPYCSVVTNRITIQNIDHMEDIGCENNIVDA